MLHLDNRAEEIKWEISEHGCQIIGRKTRFLITGQASYMKIQSQKEERDDCNHLTRSFIKYENCGENS